MLGDGYMGFYYTTIKFFLFLCVCFNNKKNKRTSTLDFFQSSASTAYKNESIDPFPPAFQHILCLTH